MIPSFKQESYYGYAQSYIARVRELKPKLYPEFLNILHGYAMPGGDVDTVRHQIQQLFSDTPELCEKIKVFLPQPGETQEFPTANTPAPAGSKVAPAAATSVGILDVLRKGPVRSVLLSFLPNADLAACHRLSVMMNAYAAGEVRKRPYYKGQSMFNSVETVTANQTGYGLWYAEAWAQKATWMSEKICGGDEMQLIKNAHEEHMDNNLRIWFEQLQNHLRNQQISEADAAVCRDLISHVDIASVMWTSETGYYMKIKLKGQKLEVTASVKNDVQATNMRIGGMSVFATKGAARGGRTNVNQENLEAAMSKMGISLPVILFRDFLGTLCVMQGCSHVWGK